MANGRPSRKRWSCTGRVPEISSPKTKKKTQKETKKETKKETRNEKRTPLGGGGQRGI